MRLRADSRGIAWGLVATFLALAFICACFSGCALFQPCPVDAPAARMVDDYREFREDGLDDAETRMLDRDAEAVDRGLDQKAREWKPPTTGLPWLDMVLALAGAAATVGASVKTTNHLRDKKRTQRGEPVAVAPMVFTSRSPQPQDPINPQ